MVYSLSPGSQEHKSDKISRFIAPYISYDGVVWKMCPRQATILREGGLVDIVRKRRWIVVENRC